MLRTKVKYENEQRPITLKVWNFELWLLCTALLLNEIYLPLKFHLMPGIVLKLCSGQKGQTDERTSQSLYATLRGHKNHQGPIDSKWNIKSLYLIVSRYLVETVEPIFKSITVIMSQQPDSQIPYIVFVWIVCALTNKYMSPLTSPASVEQDKAVAARMLAQCGKVDDL